MNYIYRSLILGLLLFSQLNNAQENIVLFNQQNLEGWDAFEPETGKHANASDVFSVENNMIRFYGKKPGYLITEKSFKNFKLTVDYRWNNDADFERRMDTRNSGVMYLVPEGTPDLLWPKGIQCQVKEGGTGDFILLQDVTLKVNDVKLAPGKSVVINRTKDATNAIGTWNTLEITCVDGKITQKVNGVIVNTGSESSVLEGRVLLQYEGFPIDFKKVEISVL